jgi:hypothetical protein
MRELAFQTVLLHWNIGDGEEVWERTGSLNALRLVCKDKVVPLHAMEAFAGRGGIVPNHSRTRQEIGVSGQRHAPVALYPWGKDPRYPLDRRLRGPHSRSGHKC